MNERIKELLSQAGVHYEVMPKDTVYEKFAELIVRECMEVGGPEDSYRDEWFNAKVDSVAKIKQHFGVEESRREKFRKSFEEAFKDGVDLSGQETP